MNDIVITLRRQERGYSLIELLMICVIVAILASIALPALASQANRANGASARSLARMAEGAIETYAVEAGTYEADAAQLRAVDRGLTDAHNLRVEGRPQTYRVSVDDVKGRTFGIERTAAGLVRFCRPAGTGDCPASGNW